MNQVRASLIGIAGAAAAVGIFGIWSCGNPPLLGGLYPPDVRARLLAHTGLGPPPPSSSNAVADDPAAAALGKALYYDAGLSPSGDVSCATCHDPTQGFGDGRALARGVSDTARHAPSLWNAAYQRWQFWDGRADTLWAQAIQPLEHPAEMGSDRLFLAHRLAAHPDYRDAYQALFGLLPDLDDAARFPPRARPVTADPADPLDQAWAAMTATDQVAINTVLSNATKAIAAFERTITSTDAPFDRFARALAAGDRSGLGALSPAAQRGAALFFGRANCWLCHTGPLFSDREFHNVLSAPDGDAAAAAAATGPGAATAAVDRGRYDGVPKVLGDPFNALGDYSDGASGETQAKLRFLKRTDEQLGQFKTPGLRNVAASAPYMHDGRFQSLTEVVDFYADLPGQPAVGHREDFMRPLGLTAAERAELVAFLQSLSDESALPALIE